MNPTKLQELRAELAAEKAKVEAAELELENLKASLSASEDEEKDKDKPEASEDEDKKEDESSEDEEKDKEDEGASAQTPDISAVVATAVKAELANIKAELSAEAEKREADFDARVAKAAAAKLLTHAGVPLAVGGKPAAEQSTATPAERARADIAADLKGISGKANTEIKP